MSPPALNWGVKNMSVIINYTGIAFIRRDARLHLKIPVTIIGLHNCNVTGNAEAN